MFKNLNYEQAHKFVEENENTFWHGWTMIQFVPTPRGATHPKGMFRNGKWGIANRVEPTVRGEWRVKVVNPGRTRS